jgi:hypothetical protein
MKSIKLFVTMYILLLSINSIAQNVGINNANPQAALDLQGDLRLRSAVLTLPNGLNNDVDLTTTKSSVYMFAGGALAIGGAQITGFTGGVDGRIVTIFNNSTTGAIQLYDANFSVSPSAAANKILTGTGSNAVIYGNGSVTLRYDGAKAKWIVMSSAYTDGLSLVTAGSGPWTVTGNDISNSNSGSVGIAELSPEEKLHVNNGNIKIGKALWASATDDRFLKFGDGPYVSVGEVGGDDLMEVRGKQITIRSNPASSGPFGSSPAGNVLIPNGNVGINAITPTQAKLVVNADFGKQTNAVFGGDGAGISLQKNWPTIAYNTYRDNSNIQRYMGTGYGYLTSVDQGSGTYFWNKLGFGAAGGSVGASEQYVMGLSQGGNLGIGTAPDVTYRLSVNGNIRSKEVVVESGWADYVFAKDYKLPLLTEVEKYIKVNNHLPEIPSAKEIQENGLKVGEVQTKMMQKIEELTLYIIEQNKKIEALEKKLNTIN